MQQLHLSIMGVRVQIRCHSPTGHALAVANFEAFRSNDSQSPFQHTYYIRRGRGPRGARGYEVMTPHRATTQLDDSYELMYYLEKSITIDVQLQRSDLFFLHGAALKHNGKACLLVAAPGSGKSTTTWGLIHNGFGYLSDEMAPIHLDAMTVVPYPHAICLKQPPPGPVPLPGATVFTSRTIHVPVRTIANVVSDDVPLQAVFFNRYDAHATVPSVARISTAEASTLIYSNGLNQLAHTGDGLAAATRIAGHAACYRVTTTGDLTQSCALLRATLDA